MVCERSVAKLGGSIITVKDSPETVNWDAMDSLVGQVLEYTRRGGRIALVLGGGSFGHYVVSGILSRKGRLEAVDAPLIQLSMLKLSVAFLHRAIEQGLRATLHPPHTYCSRGVCEYTPIVRDFEAGLTPVTYGDALVEGGETRIISGDTIAVDLTKELAAKCLFFVVDTGGVLDETGSILREVRGSHSIPRPGRSKGWDVTGGMEGKIRRAMEAPQGTLVRIVGARDLLNALEGGDVGTLVVP
ncbi:MAG: hypothetical protein LRS43_03690 [Desulfurococcales archaeon]|nr:hypothetical protein [Desulfurococcales archaeon]